MSKVIVGYTSECCGMTVFFKKSQTIIVNSSKKNDALFPNPCEENYEVYYEDSPNRERWAGYGDSYDDAVKNLAFNYCFLMQDKGEDWNPKDGYKETQEWFLSQIEYVEWKVPEFLCAYKNLNDSILMNVRS